MNNTDLPPLPVPGVIGPDICATVRLYLAVVRDLSPDQGRKVSGHLQICPECARAYRVIGRATQLVGHLEASEPSAHVDQAVMAAIVARSRSGRVPTSMRSSTRYQKNMRRRSSTQWVGLLAAAAILVMVALGVMHFALPSSNTTAFALPANLTWNNYVLYHSQDLVGQDGATYHVVSYHNMANEDQNVETTVGNKLDVMVVTDGKQTVGFDMMNHVKQMNADAWMSDDAIFDLTQLRKDLQSKQAVYLGTTQFNGQDVYRIQDDNGLVLLLDKQYKPVNVVQPTTGKAVYTKLQLLAPATVEPSMWNMDVSGFRTGTLPTKP